MGVALSKDSIDLGIVVRDAAASLAFYRDTLGLDYQGEMPMPGGSVMHRLMSGTSLIKLVAHAETCEAAGYNVPVLPREIRPGIKIAMIEDPDGNWVELLELS
jgi:catechol 2,3-dioxygenase-like lactoylglutathione lyase family enzyme